MTRSPFLPLGLAIIVALAAVMGYLFWHRAVVDASANAALLAGEVALKSGVLSESASARSALAALSDDEDFMERLLLSTEDLVPFLEELEASGSDYGASVSVVSVSDAEGEGRIRVAFSIEGSFDAVMRTLGTVEYAEHASAVRNVTLDTPGEGMWSAAVTMILAVRDTE